MIGKFHKENENNTDYTTYIVIGCIIFATFSGIVGVCIYHKRKPKNKGNSANETNRMCLSCCNCRVPGLSTQLRRGLSKRNYRESVNTHDSDDEESDDQITPLEAQNLSQGIPLHLYVENTSPRRSSNIGASGQIEVLVSDNDQSIYETDEEEELPAL